MSKGKIVVMIIAALMVVSGISMLVIGLTVGAAPVISIGNSKAAENKEIKIVSDTVDLDDFDKAKIDLSSIDMIIEKGSDYKLEYRVYEEDVPRFDVSGGKLTLTQPSNTSFFMFDFRTVADRDKEYYKLTIPDDLDDLDLVVSSADITINGVNIDGRIDLSSGDININDSEGKDLEITTSSGCITIADAEYKKLKFDVSSGDVKVTDSEIDKLKGESSSGYQTFDGLKTDEVDLRASSGDITLGIIGDEDDYSFDIDTSSGDIRIGDKKMEDDYETGDGKKGSIKADTSSGSVTVNFK